ncbi:hypothetical protein GCM10010297_22100 [Streptomyces malachitofuscus]|nr:hypothetical protein GCM10010297_22100 [Streptomyces malachitofuscus]
MASPPAPPDRPRQPAARPRTRGRFRLTDGRRQADEGATDPPQADHTRPLTAMISGGGSKETAACCRIPGAPSGGEGWYRTRARERYVPVPVQFEGWSPWPPSSV